LPTATGASAASTMRLAGKNMRSVEGMIATDGLIIRKCRYRDLDILKQLSEATFVETFSEGNSKEDMEAYLEQNFNEARLTEELGNPSSLFFLVLLHDSPAAYMKVNFDAAQTEDGYGNTLEIQRIYVLNGFKSLHIGSMLVQMAVSLAEGLKLDSVWLGVWEKNYRAIEFYKKQGFVQFGSHIFKLGDDLQTDLLMKLPLKNRS